MKRIILILSLAMLNVTAKAGNMEEKNIDQADSTQIFFGIGTNFDFLNNNIAFNKIYGELRYFDDSIISFSNNYHWSFGIDIGGYKNNTLSIVKNDFIGHSSFIDPNYLNPDSLQIINQTVKAKQIIGFSQLSVFFNPFITFKLNNEPKCLKIGIGIYGEMYKNTSYLKYSDTSILQQSKSIIGKGGKFVPTKFIDSTGITQISGWFGISESMNLYTQNAIVKFRTVVGRIIMSPNKEPIYNVINSNAQTKKFFYLIDASIMEPHSKIRVEANIRGIFPNYTPVWSIYATKQFDLRKLFDTITH